MVNDIRENIKFIRPLADLGIIANGATVVANTETLRAEFGNNFNTIIIVNNSTEELILILDGIEKTYIDQDGSFTLDWRDNLNFSIIAIKNNDGANSTSANEIRITVGRTGLK